LHAWFPLHAKCEAAWAKKAEEKEIKRWQRSIDLLIESQGFILFS